MADIRWQATNLMLDFKHKNALGEASSAFVDEADMERARQSVIRCIKCASPATRSFYSRNKLVLATYFVDSNHNVL